MGRELKRVSTDFDWPTGRIWGGYINPYWQQSTVCHHCGGDGCDRCNGEGRVWPSQVIKQKCEAWRETEPPEGNGYQLWETTSEGSPLSPIFSTLDGLCVWCAGNATTFADFRASAEEWKRMLEKNNVHHRQGNMVFI